jgi:hypothetical protein
MWPQSQFVFTLPACCFVVALNLDWRPGGSEAIVSGESNQEGQRRFTSEPHDQIPGVAYLINTHESFK